MRKRGRVQSQGDRARNELVRRFESEFTHLLKQFGQENFRKLLNARGGRLYFKSNQVEEPDWPPFSMTITARDEQ